MRSTQKNFLILLLLGVFFFVSFYLYGSLDNATSAQREESLKHAQEVRLLRGQIEDLEDKIKKNALAMDKVRNELRQSETQRKNQEIRNDNDIFDAKETAKEVLQNQMDQDLKPEIDKQPGVLDRPGGNKVAIVHQELSRVTQSRDKCSLMANYSHAQTDVQMLDMYSIIPFDNIDGGVWKQGWELKYTDDSVTSGKKLEVIVIPHSHCDPGWILTFENYYKERTRHILDGMAKHLDKKPEMRFIYAEMSFFEMWWSEQTDEIKEKVKSYLNSGQFEIVTGGWVMTDEANAHFYSIIAELIEGHEFIQNHLGSDYRPRSHWSIDPFGLSPSLPLLLSEANIKNAALQRVHYSVKKKLAQDKHLEFMWRQLWGGSDARHDVRSHVFPFYSYDVPHTCGPEPRVCCQFDFKRLPGGGHQCDWGVPPQPINDKNVDQRAHMIYDQYRKKSQLYKTNVVLIPLGDDFRYQDDFEWNNQYENYQKLFKYMNQKTEWNVHARFGTLSDYFDALDRTLKEDDDKLPVLSGDFFTYSDRDDHYWSGYFTSRPFHKQMDRVLQHYLRTAEILYSIARIQGKDVKDVDLGKLVEARRALSLFQHHDGVTGTAKDVVVDDYAQKLLSALRRSEEVSIASLNSLLDTKTTTMSFDEVRATQDSLPELRSLDLGSSLILLNTLAHKRAEVACIQVSAPDHRLKTIDGLFPEQQVSPVVTVIDGRIQISTGKYELCFWAEVGPLSTETYTLVTKENSLDFSKVKGSSKPMGLDTAFTFESSSSDFMLGNDKISARFSGITGGLRDVTLLESGIKTDLNSHFVKYTARPKGRIKNGGGDDLSGAYLFLPDREADKLEITQPAYLVIEGSLVNRIVASGPKDGKLVQRISIEKGSSSIGIQNQIDLRQRPDNIEVAMRFETSIDSGDDLFTDLNNLQIIRRKRMLGKLPIQAHFYPMPGSVYLEDAKARMTLIGAQALGVASLKSGMLEVMLDRRLQQDDNRGLFQPVLDNRVTISHFRLLIEPIGPTPKELGDSRMGHLSRLAQHESLRLHYPWVKVFGQGPPPTSKIQGLSAPLPCDFQLVTLRNMVGPTDYQNNRLVEAKSEAALVLHRWVPECRTTSQLEAGTCSDMDKIDPRSLFGTNIKAVYPTSLTLLYQNSTTISTVEVEPHRVRTVKIVY